MYTIRRIARKRAGAYYVRRMEENSANYIDAIRIFYLRVLENWPLREARLDSTPFLKSSNTIHTIKLHFKNK